MSQTLKPLCNDLLDVRRAEGRFKVQLEIPRTSTLTEGEIQKILRISSWQVDPNTCIGGLEGVRSVLLRRERPISIKGKELTGLQISGTGHRGIDFSERIPMVEGSFCPPSTQNFIDLMPGTLMSTGHAEGTKLVTIRAKYRPFGTYTRTELETKIRNTEEVSQFQLTNCIVPHVEACGSYLDSELSNEEGQFGFAVFPAPDPQKERAANEFMKRFLNDAVGRLYSESILLFYNGLSPALVLLSRALREIHDVGRVVHLQPHLQNFYLIGAMPYIVDWGTMRKLGNNAEENIYNRSIDLKRPADGYDDMFSKCFAGYEMPESLLLESSILMKELVMEIYSGRKERVDFKSIADRTTEDINEFEAITLWMKGEGFEAYKNYEHRQG